MGNDVECCCDGDQILFIIMKFLNVYVDDMVCFFIYSVVVVDFILLL